MGAITLILQGRGLEVTALEVIPQGIRIMRDRGVMDAREGRLEHLPAGETFDTILLLMNGTALAGTLEGLPGLLQALGEYLAPGGQVLMDSTHLPGEAELQYQLEFRGRKGAPFPQLFLSPDALETFAGAEGWAMELVWSGEEGEYLARLTQERASASEPHGNAAPAGPTMD
mgnify:FL=1